MDEIKQSLTLLTEHFARLATDFTALEARIGVALAEAEKLDRLVNAREEELQ